MHIVLKSSQITKVYYIDNFVVFCVAAITGQAYGCHGWSYFGRSSFSRPLPQGQFPDWTWHLRRTRRCSYAQPIAWYWKGWWPSARQINTPRFWFFLFFFFLRMRRSYATRTGRFRRDLCKKMTSKNVQHELIGSSKCLWNTCYISIDFWKHIFIKLKMWREIVHVQNLNFYASGSSLHF